MDSSTATIAAATTVADARSSRLLHRRDAGSRDSQRRQQIRPGSDRRDDELAVSTHLHLGATGRDTAGGGDRRALITTCGQPGGLAGGVNAADLHRHRCDTGQAQHQHRDQRDDAKRRLNGARAGIVDYALVLSARAMMLVNAVTMESPVTTV
jgi:hypothetical protein